MKGRLSKNTIFGLIALALSGGGSIAGKNISSNIAWVNVMYAGTNYYTCENTGFICDEFGATTCTVYVETLTGALIGLAHGDQVCTYTLNASSSSPVGYFLPDYGLILNVK